MHFPQHLSAQEYVALLSQLDVGSPIAENDNLLYEARVETAVFSQILHDEIDIIRGTKGSGKSALYRLFTDFLSNLMINRDVIILKGVEVSGDPVFAKFKDEFDHLDEIDFENFWRIYFLSLVTSKVIGSPDYASRLKPARRELADFTELARANGFPVLKKNYSLPSIVGWALSRLPRVRKIEFNPETGLAGLELGTAPREEARTPVFIAELHFHLLRALTKANCHLWLMLDRLDEVFPRRSKIERLALRGLLRTTRSFTTPRVRIKIFLRDDIFDSITEEEGFAALSHVMSRCSDTLKWSKEQIVHLLVNRVYARDSVRNRLGVSKEKLATDEEYRRKAFYLVFPEKLRRGKNQSQVEDWLFKHCEDSMGVVTPRDVIDLVRFARGFQLDVINRAAPGPISSLLSPAAVMYGHKQMSLKKKDTFLKAEFNHFWRYLERFENRKAEHDAHALNEILGPEWERVTKDLKAIGFLKVNPRTNTFSIPFLYRPCLNIRQGKTKPKATRSRGSSGAAAPN